ncbi:MFS transporter [Parvularcula sp. ZS-1/3]|uniref:MFS transporter n=1 Tax=Parvularcula mediterranea TaxID=2732508 RepID=A0A7Y3RMW4_9PROT|nr:MFS transporter [Parvularcula mediterranea]NNU17023.1 MFS transporter [Parvularcula mediterranea]
MSKTATAIEPEITAGLRPKPALGFWQVWNMSFGFFGIQMAFALQGANVSRIFQTLGAEIDQIAILWIAGPVTGLLVQPIVGYFSDKTWTPLGRRRPYFLGGAIVATLALLVMPNSPFLWVAAAMLWILDAAINVSMEPFRAFVGDKLPSRQRTQGFAMQTVFIGSGAFLASLAPWFFAEILDIANTAEAGVVPESVKYAFYVGAFFLLLTIGWTVLTSKEYSPEEMAGFETDGIGGDEVELTGHAKRPSFFMSSGAALVAIGALGFWAVAATGADKQFFVLTGLFAVLGAFFLINALLLKGSGTGSFSSIMGSLVSLPRVMRQLAVVQFFSWSALFLMWIYATPAVTSFHFGSDDPTSALYNEGANWVGWLFAIYNIVAAVYAFILPPMATRLRRRTVHSVNLVAGALGLASFAFFRDPNWLILSMVGVGMAWASILTMPYTMLSDALPQKQLGIFMGIFNFFIVLPQLIVAGTMGPILRDYMGGRAELALLVGGVFMLLGAVAVHFVDRTKPQN